MDRFLFVFSVNSSTEILYTFSLFDRNIKLFFVVEESIDDKTIGHFPFPLVLRLVRYVKLNWRSSTPKWSKRRLLERDHYCCVYCGKQATTVDHVIPRVNGGETTWLNTVSACLRCNGKKGSKSIEKSGMKLTRQPFKPTWKDITH